MSDSCNSGTVPIFRAEALEQALHRIIRVSVGAIELARSAEFIELDQRDLGRPVPPAKNISLSPLGKSGA
jgi:hypothetical protein